MFGRLPKSLRGVWEGTYDCPDIHSYPRGEFRWTLGAGLLGGVRGKSVDLGIDVPADLRGSYSAGEIWLEKRYRGERPMLSEDGKVKPLSEVLDESGHREMLEACAIHWCERCGTRERPINPTRLDAAKQTIKARYRQELAAGSLRVDYVGSLYRSGTLEGRWVIPAYRMPSFGIEIPMLRGVWVAKRVSEVL